MQEAEVISVTTIPKRKFVSFEVVDWKEDDEYFFLLSRWIKNFTAIHSHWAVCVAYFIGPYELVALLAVIVDAVRAFVIYTIPWAASGIWAQVVRFYNYVWDLAGESIKAYTLQFLKLMGKCSAVAIVAYFVYAFIKTGSYSKLLTPLCDWLGL